MIKSALNTIINTLFADSSNITAAELRSVQDDLLDNAYGTIITDDQTTTNVFTASDAVNLQYDLEVSKQGRFVNVVGTLIKTTSDMIETVEWLNITDSEYLPNSTHNFRGFTDAGALVKLSFAPTGELFLDSFIGADTTIYIETTYKTAN